MNDKIVTHADRQPLADLRQWIAHQPDHPWTDVRRSHLIDTLDRLIAAAEADAPPLPEGWVLHDDGLLGSRVFWHRGGDLYYQRECRDMWHRDITPIRKYLTPLRPTVTEADVERAARAAAEQSTAIKRDVWSAVPESTQELWRSVARAAFAAAGIEVTS